VDRTDARLAYDDFVRMPDDGKRHEIVDGVHNVPTRVDLTADGYDTLATPFLPGWSLALTRLFR